jgi:hypothetical protein
VHAKVARSIDSKTDLLPRPYDRDRDVVTDEDRFADPARQKTHVISIHGSVRGIQVATFSQALVTDWTESKDIHPQHCSTETSHR